jgi:hypothetical protein
MATFKLRAGADIETLTHGEMRDALAEHRREQRADARGFKWMRLPEFLIGKAAGGQLSLGLAAGETRVGPNQGYVWSLSRLVVDGLTSGATPDVVNLYRNDNTTGPPLWQFNGNNFAYTFGKMQVTLLSGDSLTLVNVGTFTATGQIRITGELWELPSERIFEFI